MSHDLEEEPGSASLLVVSLIGVIVLLGLAAAFMTASAAAHRQAQSAADLAALAAASTVQQGGEACATAERVAVANHARVITCDVSGEDVALSVEVDGPEFLGHSFAIVGQARAGPRPG